MIFLLLGGASLVMLMAVLGAFSKAQVASIKSFGIWFVAIAGVALATLLFFTGRGGTAIAALVMLGPLVWSWLKQAERPAARRGRSAAARPGGGRMSVDEAYSVLGLQPGADAEAIRAAHRRLMRLAHPDTGGSDWLAARINQARDVLLG